MPLNGFASCPNPAFPEAPCRSMQWVSGSETSTTILRSFLNAVQTDAGLPAVADVEIRNPFNPATSYDAKTSVVDVRARDVNGTIYTMEVQALPEVAFRERALYYWAYAYAYAGQLGKGQDYEFLYPMVGVNIVDFTVFPKAEPVHTTFHLISDGALTLTDHLAIHFLELPKLPDDAATSTGRTHILCVFDRNFKGSDSRDRAAQLVRSLAATLPEEHDEHREGVRDPLTTPEGFEAFCRRHRMDADALREGRYHLALAEQAESSLPPAPVPFEGLLVDDRSVLRLAPGDVVRDPASTQALLQHYRGFHLWVIVFSA
jgi:hypothetical protein